MAADGERVFQIEDYLYNAVVAAKASPGGMLYGIQNVEYAVPTQLNIFPAVGVAFSHFDSEPLGMGPPTYQRTAMFDIMVAVKQDFSTAAADTVQQARLAVRNYVDNGNGLGLIPLLESKPTLGGLIQMSWITNLDLSVYQQEDSMAGTIAAARFTFRCGYRTL